MLWLIVDRTELKSERQGLQDSRFGIMYGKKTNGYSVEGHGEGWRDSRG